MQPKSKSQGDHGSAEQTTVLPSGPGGVRKSTIMGLATQICRRASVRSRENIECGVINALLRCYEVSISGVDHCSPLTPTLSQGEGEYACSHFSCAGGGLQDQVIENQCQALFEALGHDR